MLCLLDAFRCLLDSLQDWLDLSVEHAHLVMHLEELCIRVITHAVKDLLSELLLMFNCDGPLSLNSFELFNVTGSLLSVLFLLVRRQFGCERSLRDATFHTRWVICAHVWLLR